ALGAGRVLRAGSLAVAGTGLAAAHRALVGALALGVGHPDGGQGADPHRADLVARGARAGAGPVAAHAVHAEAGAALVGLGAGRADELLAAAAAHAGPPVGALGGGGAAAVATRGRAAGVALVGGADDRGAGGAGARAVAGEG